MPNNFGIIGNLPDQRDANSGVYKLSEINELQSVSKWSNKNALTRIETINYSAAATNQINFTSIEETTFRVHLLSIIRWKPVTQNVNMNMRMFLSGSGTAESGATSYNYHQLRGDDAGTFNNTNNTAINLINFGPNMSNSVFAQHTSNLWIFNAGDSTQRTSVAFDTNMKDDQNDRKFVRGIGACNVVDDVTGFQIYVSSGNIDTIQATLYGVQ
jgi:hypothetical protein